MAFEEAVKKLNENNDELKEEIGRKAKAKEKRIKILRQEWEDQKNEISTEYERRMELLKKGIQDRLDA